VTFEGLLAFIGVLVAVLAIARPVQRRSLSLFVPMWFLGAATVLSLILIVFREAPLGVAPPFRWRLDLVLFGLTLGAFVLPVGAAVWSWISWHRAKLTGNKLARVEDLFQAALREREFDEVERILRKNQQRLIHLPAGAATVLFDPAMVEALLNSHSLVHLELLGNVPFLKSLENRFAAVDVVTRALLRSGVSPLRSAVVSRYGGLEHLVHSEADQALIEKTFQNPEWYFDASAHYPLVISAVEELRSGKYDSSYNDVGRDYEASQGISARSRCPIYLAAKTEVLAIKTALEARVEKDFYVTDLWDVFRSVQERSTFDRNVWESPLSNSEFPTPYAYLLYTFAADLRDLSATAVRTATSKTDPPRIELPGRLARDLALAWSFCVWSIADSEAQVAHEFRNAIIREYLVFILELGWGASEIYFGQIQDAESLDIWRDLFLQELQHRFRGDSAQKSVLKEAMESLDQGKSYVSDGYTWLEENLFGRPEVES
jgi:hypothetical protein